MAVRARPPTGRPSCETKLLDILIDRRDAARAQVTHDMRDPRTTLYKSVKELIKGLDVAKDNGRTNFAMLWLCGGKMRKSLLDMKEHGRLEEWLCGALFPSITCLPRNMRCSLLQLPRRHRAAAAGPLLACRLQVHGRGGDTHWAYRQRALPSLGGHHASGNPRRGIGAAGTVSVRGGCTLRVCAPPASLLPAPSHACMRLREASVQSGGSPHVCATGGYVAGIFYPHACAPSIPGLLLSGLLARDVCSPRGLSSRARMCAQFDFCVRHGEPAKLPNDNKEYVKRYRDIYSALCQVINLEFAERGPPIFYKDAEGYALITREPQDTHGTSLKDLRRAGAREAQAAEEGGQGAQLGDAAALLRGACRGGGGGGGGCGIATVCGLGLV